MDFGSKKVLAVKCNRFCQTAINKREISLHCPKAHIFLMLVQPYCPVDTSSVLNLRVEDILTRPPGDTVQSPLWGHFWSKPPCTCVSQRAFPIAYYLILFHWVKRKNTLALSDMWGPERSSDWSKAPRCMGSREEKPGSCPLTKYLSQHTTITPKWWRKPGKGRAKEVLSDRT